MWRGFWQWFIHWILIENKAVQFWNLRLDTFSHCSWRKDISLAYRNICSYTHATIGNYLAFRKLTKYIYKCIAHNLLVRIPESVIYPWRVLFLFSGEKKIGMACFNYGAFYSRPCVHLLTSCLVCDRIPLINSPPTTWKGNTLAMQRPTNQSICRAVENIQ